MSRIDDLNELSKAISPQTDSPGVLENGQIARIRKSAILAARKRLLYAVGGYDPRVIYRCTDRYSSNTTCMRNENEYIAVELQPKNVILAIFRRFNGHKAVESGDNQFVFRVGPDEYCRFPLRHVRYMAVRPLAHPPTSCRTENPALPAIWLQKIRLTDF